MTRNREFALIDNSTLEVTTSDSIMELTDSILAGHRTETADGRLALRHDALADRANTLQALIVADADAQTLGEDALTVMLHDRRTETVIFDGWESVLPLFLMATGYAPFTDVPRPSGATIVWLDPHTERTFLDSLASLGAVQLFVADPDPLDDAA